MLPKLPIEILTIDLSTNSTSRSQINDEAFLKKYLGGRGIATYMLLNEHKPDMDPYDENAPVIFASGIMTGTVVPSSGRTSVLFKSPATGMFFKTNVGGHLDRKSVV